MSRDYFHSRLDLLGARMKELNAPVDIDYARGTTVVRIAEVTVGHTNIEEEYPNAEILVKETRDYIFDYSAISGTINEPQPGDTITEVDTGIKFEVIPVTTNHCFKWTTQTRLRLRVHTIKANDPIHG